MQDSGITSITVQDLLHPNEFPLVPQICHIAMLPRPGRHVDNWNVSCLQVLSGSVWFTYIPNASELLD